VGNPRLLWGCYDYDRVMMDKDGLVTFNPDFKDEHEHDGKKKVQKKERYETTRSFN
jgi:hypothetical protein